MNEHFEKPPLNAKIRSIVCAMLVNLLVGTFYAYSNLNPYVASYYKKKPKDTIITMQIWIFFQSVFTILSVKVAEKIGPWTTNLIGFVGFTFMQIVASWIKDATTFIILYGVLCGAFMGLGYLQALYISWTYFPNQKSAATGAILLCTGLSASFMSPITTSIVNPNNLLPTDPKYGDRVPLVFQIYTIIYGVLALFGCLLQPKPWESKFLKEHRAAKKLHRSQQFHNDEHREVTQETLSRNCACDYSKQLACHSYSPEDIAAVHKHELIHEVHWFGGGEHAMMISHQMAHDRISDLHVWDLKFHKLVQSSHRHVGEWHKPRLTYSKSVDNADKELNPDAHKHDEKHPSKQDLLRQVLECNHEVMKDRVAHLKSSEPATFKQAFFSRSFLYLVIMAVGSSIYNYCLNSNWKAFYLVELSGTSDSKLSFIITFGSITSCCVRLLFGFLLLKVKIKYLYWIQISLTIFSCFTFDALMKNYGSGVIYMMLAMACLGMQFIIFPTACTMTFGSKFGSMLYPYIFMVFSLSNFGQYFLYNFYASKSKNPEIIFYIFGALSVVALGVSFFIDLKPDWGNQKKRDRGNGNKVLPTETDRLPISNQIVVLDSDHPQQQPKLLQSSMPKAPDLQ